MCARCYMITQHFKMISFFFWVAAGGGGIFEGGDKVLEGVLKGGVWEANVGN